MARNLFRPVINKSRTLIGNAGYDNPRENIDPHVKTKVVSTQEIGGSPVFTKGGLPFGEIWVKGNGTADTVATATSTQITRFANNGESNNTTPDHTNDHITINKSGKYLVTISISFSGDASVDWSFSLFLNNGTTECENVHTNRKLGAGGDIGSASMSGICDFTSGQTVELWMIHGAGVNKDITIQDCALSLVQIGG